MDNCLFCKFVDGQLDANIIYEDQETMAILDIHPIAPGHLFIIPKFHAENILEVPDGKMGTLFNTVKKVAGILKESMNCDGFTIGINHGKVSGQAIDHLHIHIIPRWLNDGGKSIHSIVNNPPKESLSEIREKIIKYL